MSYALSVWSTQVEYLCIVKLIISRNIGCVALPWHFEFYILKCKNFIDFLNELGNFKQKNFYTLKHNFFYIWKQQTQLDNTQVEYMSYFSC